LDEGVARPEVSGAGVLDGDVARTEVATGAVESFKAVAGFADTVPEPDDNTSVEIAEEIADSAAKPEPDDDAAVVVAEESVDVDDQEEPEPEPDDDAAVVVAEESVNVDDEEEPEDVAAAVEAIAAAGETIGVDDVGDTDCCEGEALPG